MHYREDSLEWRLKKTLTGGPVWRIENIPKEMEWGDLVGVNEGAAWVGVYFAV